MEITNLEVAVGTTRTLVYELQTMASSATVYSDNDITSATVFAYEVGDGIRGQVDSATANSITDADRTEAADFWNDTFVQFTSGSNDGEIRRVSDFGSTILTLDVTIDALPATPAANDEYRILCYPVIPTTDLNGHAQGTVSGNTASFQITAANGCTASERTIIILLKVTFTVGGATDVEQAAWKIRVT